MLKGTSIQEVSLTLASLEQCFITYLHVLLSSVSNKDYSEIDFITRPETHQLIYFASLLQNGNLQIKMYGSGGFGVADSIDGLGISKYDHMLDSMLEYLEESNNKTQRRLNE